MITARTRHQALEKLAYFGPSVVFGSPPRNPPPPPTVGQVLYNAFSPASPLSNKDKRLFRDSVVATGKDVNEPAGSLFRAGIGALAGNMLATTLGLGPFARGAFTATGAHYGYNY